jgi:XapX domain-containing protein
MTNRLQPHRWRSIVQTYLVSLAAGILMGFLYSMLRVRSPAPPPEALVGLAGMLIGAEILPLVQRMFTAH